MLKTLSWSKNSTREVIKVNIPRKSMKAIVLFFTKKDSKDSEEFVFPALTKVNVTVEGNSNDIYSEGLERRNMYREASRFFGGPKYVFRREFYTDKFACVIDFRTINDEDVSESGRKLIGTQAGILLEIEKEVTLRICPVTSSWLPTEWCKSRKKVSTEYLTKKLDTPFHMIIAGMTACGKTHYLLEMLEKNFKGYFDFIYIVCPTLRENETYKNWKFLSDPDVFAVPCEHDDVEDFLTMIVGHAKGIKSLIILDDCAFTQTVKNRTGELVKLVLHGRQIGISTIVITQQLTFIAKAYRDNVSKIVFFYCPRKNDRKNIFENYLHVDKEEEKKILEELKNKKYAGLEILTIHSYTHKVVVP